MGVEFDADSADFLELGKYLASKLADLWVVSFVPLLMAWESNFTA